MKDIIDVVEVELYDNLSLVVKDVEYTPGEEAKVIGLPEDCHPGSAGEIDWKDENVFLVYRADKIERKIIDGKVATVRTPYEAEYKAPAGLAELYYDFLLAAIEEM